jgi:hypothetical protein
MAHNCATHFKCRLTVLTAAAKHGCKRALEGNKEMLVTQNEAALWHEKHWLGSEK